MEQKYACGPGLVTLFVVCFATSLCGMGHFINFYVPFAYVVRMLHCGLFALLVCVSACNNGVSGANACAEHDFLH